MKILLDECVPAPIPPILRYLLRGHEVHYVPELGWASKKDKPLLRDAADRRYGMFVTNDINQFNDPDECDAIKRSRMHHVTYETEDGLDGLGRATGAICAAMRGIVRELDAAPGQRLARVTSLSGRTKRYRISDPSIDPPSGYWK